MSTVNCGTSCTTGCNESFILQETSPSAEFAIPTWGNAEISLDMNGDTTFEKPVNLYPHQLFRMTVNNMIKNSKIILTDYHVFLDSVQSDVMTLKETAAYYFLGTSDGNKIFWRINKHDSATYALGN